MKSNIFKTYIVELYFLPEVNSWLFVPLFIKGLRAMMSVLSYNFHGCLLHF